MINIRSLGANSDQFGSDLPSRARSLARAHACETPDILIPLNGTSVSHALLATQPRPPCSTFDLNPGSWEPWSMCPSQ